ncbi:MAG: hypothetical protein F9K21_02090 [Rhodocyclaceae bacterium]|nr:MAG: hypothetical protein F9K21_02090 [Rhodocyclaceae bacterium]CAG0927522.1 hypothetical protein RHDC3_00437 [Rhodocyclaceae bacterium]
MPTSIRERLLQEIVNRLSPLAQAEGAQIKRSPTTAISRDASPALLLFPEAESIAQRANDRIERHLIVRLVAVARETSGEAAEGIADRLQVAAHAALFADINFGGLCIGLQQLDCEWDIEDADATAAAIPTRYQVTYRTLVHDLTAQG